jgi:hypothetical protein
LEHAVLVPHPEDEPVEHEEHVPEEGRVVEGMRVEARPGKRERERHIGVFVRLKGQRVGSEAGRPEAQGAAAQQNQEHGHPPQTVSPGRIRSVHSPHSGGGT